MDTWEFVLLLLKLHIYALQSYIYIAEDLWMPGDKDLLSLGLLSRNGLPSPTLLWPMWASPGLSDRDKLCEIHRDTSGAFCHRALLLALEC